jgi:ATP-dependent DNA ligase
LNTGIQWHSAQIVAVQRQDVEGKELHFLLKYDGYRLRVERDGDRVRLITKGGHDWSKRYPWITEAARKIKQEQFVLDGEAVILGVESEAAITRARSGVLSRILRQRSCIASLVENASPPTSYFALAAMKTLVRVVDACSYLVRIG